jgi:RNA polymerase sigma-70 factor, ECF subfamily
VMMMDQINAEVYQTHAAQLIRYATVLVGPDDATDVVTDAVLNVFASPKWREIESRRAYLFRSVLNQAQAFHRANQRRNRREHLVASRTASTQVGPSPSIDAQRALQTLTAQQRAVVYLSYWEDQSATDIAALLNISEGSVKKQLARARDQLRKVMTR